MRGLVRLYARQAELLVGELWTIRINVTAPSRSPTIQRPKRLSLPRQQEEVEEVGPNLEELIENAGNTVARVQDITLREVTLPEIRVWDVIIFSLLHIYESL
ncbi:unnamed protein product [Leptidea sinapis]|uniref:Rad21/Rec8-like protein N-terminal domain-containing protein n=1 Tax=Leptidea sinapis TaxID=189913 RepID=A0A5E4PLP3_9NEOP|nr:unnamed protein product [Leptidea sinapis]